MSASTSGPASVRFPRAEHRGILLGLSGSQLTVASAAVVVAGSSVFAGGAAGLGLTAPLWLSLLAVGTVRVSGRAATRWLPLLASWSTRRGFGGTEAVRSTRVVTATETVTLPGIPGALPLDVAPETGAAIVLDRRAGTVTAVLRVTSAGFLLADVAAQDHRAASWGRVLGSLCQDSDVVRLQVLHRTLPASTSPRLLDDVPTLPARIAAEVATSARGDQRETLLAVALRAGRARGGRLDPAKVAETDRRLWVLQTAVERAELTAVGWLGPAELRRALRASYDPEAAASPSPLGDTAFASGPMAVRERWDHLEADGCLHACFWVAEWPRSEVNPGFLQHLLLSPGVRRTVSLTVEPVPPAAALREIRRAKVEHIADAAQRAKMGQVEDEATRAEQADLARRESEIVAGHGDLRFTGMVTVSATSAADLATAGAALRSAAAQALCEVRRLDGQHGLAHAAGALPLARRLL